MKHRLMVWSGALSLLFALGGCGGGGSSTPPAAEVPSQGRLAVSQPGELAGYVQKKLRQRSAARAAQPAAVLDGAPATSVAPAPGAAPAAPAYSKTLLQEAGVDEADLLKTDGRWLHSLYPQGHLGPRLAVHERQADGSALLRSTLMLPAEAALSIDVEGQVLTDDSRTLAVLTQHWAVVPAAEACSGCAATGLPFGPPQWVQASVGVQRVDVSNPAAPVAGTRLAIEGTRVDSRRIGNRLVVVTRHMPVLAAEQLPGTDAEREARIAAVTAADVLPRVRVNGGPLQPLLKDTDCLVQTDNGSYGLEITAITQIDLASPTLERSSRCFVGGAEALYMTAANLYIATSRQAYTPVATAMFPEGMTTDLHKFSLAGGDARYLGSGTVEGHLGWDAERKALRLSEQGGDLRVLTFTGQEGWVRLEDAGTTAASPARLTVLRESGGALQTLSTLPNSRRPATLGKTGEQLYGVRFDGTRAYLVTFRRIDPLYVLDLSDPADPRIAGELEVQGVSEHLFPLPGGLLMGVGRDADADGRLLGLKVALFDVADASAPRVLGTSTFGDAGSHSALDLSRHGIALFTAGATVRVALPVQLARGDSLERGLVRFDIDTAARSLAARPMLGSMPGSYQADWWLERAAFIGDEVYHLRSGDVTGYAWAP